jgi:hypothetical protein
LYICSSNLSNEEILSSEDNKEKWTQKEVVNNEYLKSKYLNDCEKINCAVNELISAFMKFNADICTGGDRMRNI